MPKVQRDILSNYGHALWLNTMHFEWPRSGVVSGTGGHDGDERWWVMGGTRGPIVGAICVQ